MRKIGIEYLDFNYQMELIKYKYLTGEGLSAKEWKRLNEREKYNTYFAWKESIRKKNENKTDLELKELIEYLSDVINQCEPKKEMNTMFFSVAISGITTFLMNNLGFYTDIKGNLLIVEICSVLITAAVMLGVGVVMSAVISPLWDTKTEIAMLKKYQHVIQEILEDRENTALCGKIDEPGKAGEGKRYM